MLTLKRHKKRRISSISSFASRKIICVLTFNFNLVWYITMSSVKYFDLCDYICFKCQWTFQSIKLYIWDVEICILIVTEKFKAICAELRSFKGQLSKHLNAFMIAEVFSRKGRKCQLLRKHLEIIPIPHNKTGNRISNFHFHCTKSHLKQFVMYYYIKLDHLNSH